MGTQPETTLLSPSPSDNVTAATDATSALIAATVSPGDAAGQAELAAAYVTALQGEADAVLSSTSHATLVPLQYNGDFNWSWEDGQGRVNRPSYNYMSGAVSPSSTSPGTCQIGGGGSFTNIYEQLINSITWQFSAADNATLQAALTNSDTQGTSLQETYSSTVGNPTAAQWTAAATFNPMIDQNTPDGLLNFILLYEVGYLWAGSPSGGLSLTAMQNAQNLNNLLPNTPPSGQSTLDALTAYLNALGPATQLRDLQSQGSYTLAQIKKNLGSQAAAANGGVQQSNPISTGFFPGYGSSEVPGNIQIALGNTGQTAVMSFSASTASASSYNITFSGSAGIDWGGDLLDISAGTSFQGDVAHNAGATSNMKITMTYPGVTMVPLVPAAFMQSSAGSSGWLEESVIFQAMTNHQAGANASSGYIFLNGPPQGITLGENGIGYLSAIVISDYPTIAIEFDQGSSETLSSWLATQTDVSTSLFGFIPIGSASINTYSSSVSQSQSGSSFKLTLTPPKAGSGITIATADQAVPVLAGAITWLGVAPA